MTTRPTLYAPRKPITPTLMQEVLSLVTVNIPEEIIATWVKLERMVAYDWAWRVYLAASDNSIQQRDKPSFVTAAEKSGRLVPGFDPA